MNHSAPNTQNPVADFLNGALLAQAKDFTARNNHPESLALAEQMRALNPGTEAAAFVGECGMAFAKHQIEEGETLEAECLLRRILKLSAPPEGAREMLATLCRAKAEDFAQQKLFYQAEAVLCEAVTLAPKNDAVVHELARLEAEAKKPQADSLFEELAHKECGLRKGNAAPELLAQCLYEQAALYTADEPHSLRGEILLHAANALAPQNKDIFGTLITVSFNRAYHLAVTCAYAEAEHRLWPIVAVLPHLEPARLILQHCIKNRMWNLSHSSEKYEDAGNKLAACLTVKDPADSGFIRVGQQGDGGYVMVDRGLNDAVVYSLGVGGDVSFDRQLAERGCHIYQYDHTVEALPEQHPHFHWSKLGLSTDGETDPQFRSLRHIIAANGHSKRRDLILKIDIEGSEWPILAELDDAILGQFSQIVGEFHGIFDIIHAKQGDLIIQVLRKIEEQFQLVHIHGNNICPPRFIGGHTFSGAYELTFMRKEGNRFKLSKRHFPTELDCPCIPGRADHHNGRGGF